MNALAFAAAGLSGASGGFTGSGPQKDTYAGGAMLGTLLGQEVELVVQALIHI